MIDYYVEEVRKQSAHIYKLCYIKYIKYREITSYFIGDLGVTQP